MILQEPNTSTGCPEFKRSEFCTEYHPYPQQPVHRSPSSLLFQSASQTDQYKQHDPTPTECQSLPSFGLGDKVFQPNCLIFSLKPFNSECFNQQEEEQEALPVYCDYVARQVELKTGATVVVEKNSNKSPRQNQPSPYPTFRIQGSQESVQKAYDCIQREYLINFETITFHPRKLDDLGLEQIDPEHKADLTPCLGGSFDLKQSWRNPDENLLLKCRKFVSQSIGRISREVEVPLKCFLWLIGPKSNRNLIEMSLKHEVFIDIPRLVWNEDCCSSIKILLTSSKESSIVECLEEIRSHEDGDLHEMTMDVEDETRNWLANEPEQFKALSRICEENGCILILSDSCLILKSSESVSVTSCCKKLFSLIYENQQATVQFADRRLFPEQLDELIMFNVKVSADLNKGILQISGSQNCVERALDHLNRLTVRTGCWTKAASFSLAVPIQVREFVSGKKDGKLVKIMRETGVMISLQPRAHHPNGPVEHLVIRIEGSNILAVITALGLVKGELPAECQFYVPESQHKRLIGHGGKVIQQVMKRYAVYVKFLNTAEALENAYGSAMQGKLGCILDNVIVRTPAKNGHVLELVKDDILAMAEEEEPMITGSVEKTSILISKLDLIKNRDLLLNADQSLEIEASMMAGKDDNQVLLTLSGREDVLGEVLEDMVIESERLEAVPSPTISTSSTVNSNIFKHFNSAVLGSPQLSLPSPTLTHAPASLSDSGSLALSWSPGSSPSNFLQATSAYPYPSSVEEEMQAAGKIMDSMFGDFSEVVGPKGLNCQLDPIFVQPASSKHARHRSPVASKYHPRSPAFGFSVF